jgi:hypothetical protein
MSRNLSLLVIGAAVLAPLPVAAAGVKQGIVPVSAVVQPSAAVKLVVVPINISISTDDILRGYIDVPVGSLLSVKAGQTLPPVIIDFSMGDGVFRSVEVRDRDQAKVQSLDSTRRTDASASTEDSPGSDKKDAATSAGTDEGKKSVESAQFGDSSAGDGNSAPVAYRFRLSDKARPGQYQIPVVLNITF